jgi:hypothetical protein
MGGLQEIKNNELGLISSLEDMLPEVCRFFCEENINYGKISAKWDLFDLGLGLAAKFGYDLAGA